MHSTLLNLLNRKNGKVPVNDGRKIVLVLFGGIMVGVRGAGGLVALEELGLSQAFDQIYTMSSGFLNASYFLSGQIKLGAAAYYNELSGKKFINPFRIWRIADIEYLFKVVRDIKPLEISKILSNRTKLYTMLCNSTLGGEMEYLEVHDFKSDDYFNILKASSSLKFLTNSTVQIGNSKYRDIFRNNALNLFVNKVLSTDATDILILYNYPWQQRYIHPKLINEKRERIYGACLTDISGGVEYLEKFTRFQTNSHKLKEDCQKAGDKIKRLFGSAKPVELYL